MESNTRFLFRDHSESEMAGQSSPGSDVSSVSDDETDLDSMTGKGIERLCSELLELKLSSNEEFHKNIFSNYSAFIRILEEAEILGNEIMQMKTHISTQKGLLKELVNIARSEPLSEEAMDSIVEEFITAETLPSSELQDHISNVSETFDILLLENRIEEALDLIESEDENFQSMKFEGTCSPHELKLFGSAISESKSGLRLRLTDLASNPRISSSELQNALLALCRLGEAHLAAQLSLEHYHFRIENGARSSSIIELARLVFSTISRAAKSFVALFGKGSSFETELLPWAKGETKAYANRFNKYLSSNSEIPLGTAVQAVEASVSFCSLLEDRRLVLRPYLVKLIGPSIENFLLKQMEQFKKVVGVFTSSDSLVLGKYLVSEILTEGSFSLVSGKEPEYCVLTSSGQKFVMLVQTITEDVSPLFALQMEGSFFRGLVTVLDEYVLSLEKALGSDSDFPEKRGLSLQQQISVLANLSTLEKLLPRLKNEDAIRYQQKKMDNFASFAREASSEIRVRFFKMYIRTVMLHETPDICSVAHDLTPSLTFQKLFLELRKIERLAEDSVFEKEWLSEILRELVEAIFDWISTNTDMWISNESSTLENSFNYKQFALDMQFLVEITNYGGYFSSDPSALTDLMKTTCLSAGLRLESDSIHIGNALDCAKVIKNLLEIEKTMTLTNEESIQDDATTYSGDSMASDTETVATDEPEIVGILGISSLDTYSSPLGGSKSL